ncbi:MAG: hypothetical protein D6693_03685 [Planctomycetota bacterium]|nr:MAG: hypothetical protein D6693_03685 [Planctomycetota bacterium]
MSCALAAGGVAEAQSPVSYNRVVRNIAVTPDPTAPGGWVVTGVFTIEATPAAVLTEGVGLPLDDVSTIMEVQVNGVPVGAVPFSLQVDPLSVGPCGGTCGSGITNGMSAALLCIDGVCQFPPISAPVPLPSSIQPGDELMILLRPSPGALPENNTADDLRRHTHTGNPVGWNRGVKAVALTPSLPPAATEAALGDAFFDIVVDIEIGSLGLTESLRLGVVPTLLINGQPSPVPAIGCNDWIAAPGDLCQVCTLFQCGTASCGGQNVQLLCRVIENDFNLSFCGCVGEQQFVFPGVPVQPADEVMILLRPAPGALPELPGFGDDDTGRPPTGCAACPGDLNGDGVVNGGDISFILNIFNQVCFPQ